MSAQERRQQLVDIGLDLLATRSIHELAMDEVAAVAGRILGMTLITHQTGPQGRLVKKVLVEQGLNIAKELYLSIVADRASA